MNDVATLSNLLPVVILLFLGHITAHREPRLDRSDRLILCYEHESSLEQFGGITSPSGFR
jgi:hypothetical protein